MSSAPTKLITADELLRMGNIGRCELIYGELVMMSPAGFEHGVIAGRIARFLSEYIEENDLGLVPAAETGFKLSSKPDLVRAPDASFVRKSRVPKSSLKKYFPGVPDLAVEVISPDDTRREVAEKVNMWLAHGAQSCWVVDPDTMSVTIHRTGEKPIRFCRSDELRDEPTLPGFKLALSKVFKHP